jgi:hypothetical protein
MGNSSTSIANHLKNSINTNSISPIPHNPTATKTNKLSFCLFKYHTAYCRFAHSAFNL